LRLKLYRKEREGLRKVAKLPPETSIHNWAETGLPSLL